MPTVAASDAPCSALSVIHKDNGAADYYQFFPSNPTLVLVDSAVIAKSPVKFTLAGMGDALATYIEARACHKRDGSNLAGASAGDSLQIGQAAAHAVHNGFTTLEECHDCLYGQLVSFGVITQLVLENAPWEELKDILDFCVSVGLPVTMSEIGVKNPAYEKIRKVAEIACLPADNAVNMPFAIDADMVCGAIFAADRFGQDALRRGEI